MRSLVLLLLVAGCVAPPPSAPAASELDRELAGRSAGTPASCVSNSPPETLRIVDSRTLVYREGRTIWVNRLDSDCPGLRPMETLLIEVHGSQYCRGDHVRAIPFEGGIAGPICILGDFTPWRRMR